VSYGHFCAKENTSAPDNTVLTTNPRNQIKSNQIKFICDKKEHIATQKKQSKYVDRTQRQYKTALTSAVQNKNTTRKVDVSKLVY